MHVLFFHSFFASLFPIFFLCFLLSCFLLSPSFFFFLVVSLNSYEDPVFLVGSSVTEIIICKKVKEIIP